MYTESIIHCNRIYTEHQHLKQYAMHIVLRDTPTMINMSALEQGYRAKEFRNGQQ